MPLTAGTRAARRAVPARAGRWGKDAVKAALRRVGYDVVPYPPRYGLEWHLNVLFRFLGVNCVLDVGAHEGEFGRMLRRIGYRGQIVSFEPTAVSFGRLEHARRGDSRWCAYQLALGDDAGRRALHVSPSHTNLNSFLAFTDFGRGTFNQGLTDDRLEDVRVERLDGILDSLIAPIRRPGIYLKIDTQGYDMSVIHGAEGCLDRILALQTEMSVRPVYEGMTPYQEAIDEIERLGFVLSAVFPVSVGPGMHLTEFDCVMVRAGD